MPTVLPTALPTVLSTMLTTREIIVVCGPGGVGKTTTAAAMGVAAVLDHDARVLVLTVDPARRLATALGLEAIGNTETPVPTNAFENANLKPRGELWFAMLDTKKSWDDLVQRHAPDAATAQAIKANPLYDNITGRFVQSHDYIAMERLYEIHLSGRYDLIIVDTPPSRNAIDFLDAPERMADFFSSRFLRWLIAPYRSKFVSMASRPFMQLADRVLGSDFLQQIADFFVLFQTMYDGFVERATAVDRLLHDRRTDFVVVSTLETAPASEASFFIDALTKRGFSLRAIVANKCLPSSLASADAARLARSLLKPGGVDAIAAALDKATAAEPLLESVLVSAAMNFERLAITATKQRDLLRAFERTGAGVTSVPLQLNDVHDIGQLAQLAQSLNPQHL